MKQDNQDNVKEKLALLPHNPGVYQFLDHQGKVIYVGKAKDIKKRVSSYFRPQHQENRKLAALVRNIRDIRSIVVHTETDALLLENNLIKNYQPRYNILLKDDKTFPWIAVTDDPYPRVFSTRRLERDGTRYYGPYTSGLMHKSLLDLVRKLYAVRTCSLKLTPETIAKGKFDKCLEYHIGNCKAPCTGLQSQKDYLANIAMVENILKGHLKEAEDFLRRKMEESAANLRFEEAQQYMNKLAMLRKHQKKTVIVSPKYTNLDVFSLIVDGDSAYCNFMRVVRGAVVNSMTVEGKLQLDESESDILTFAIMQMMDRMGLTLSKKVLVSVLPDVEAFAGSTFSIPRRGDKLELLNLSLRNVKAFRMERLRQMENLHPERHTDRVMETMKRDLQLDKQPRHIECFDNSNIQGAYPVAACVVFRDGKPSKKEYRHFNIKTVAGIDDFASMQEVIFRRYKKILEEGLPLPDLIVVDGGKGQLSSAYETLTQLGLEQKIPVIGLAKRLEEVFYPDDPVAHYLDKSSETLKVLKYIRDEAHRFGITFHRNKRSLAFIKTELEQIPNLGNVSIGKLLKQFRTVSRIKSALVEELAEVVGKSRAESIRAFYGKPGHAGVAEE